MMSAKEIRICKTCGKEFSAYLLSQTKKRYCSQRCVYADPGIRAARAQRMRSTNLRRRDIISKRMSENNPSANPDVIAKAIRTKQKKGIANIFAGTRGGNGNITYPQQILAEALGWKTEVPVPIKPPQKGYPSNYKIDIGNAELKIGIEVDGSFHRTTKGKALDLKKENKLRELGWSIVRFSNDEVLSSLSEVVSAVKSIQNERNHHAVTQTSSRV